MHGSPNSLGAPLWWVGLVLLFLLAGTIRRAWEKYRQRLAESWPSTIGHVESVEVREKTSGRSRYWIGELAYSYSVAGSQYSGRYGRRFDSEEDAQDFVDYLHRKQVSVRYRPRKPAASMILDEAVDVALQGRPALADSGNCDVPSREVPGWMKPLVWPLVVVALVGVVVSLWVHVGAWQGKQVVPNRVFDWLNSGLVIVWPATILVFAWRSSSKGSRRSVREEFPGLPPWTGKVAGAMVFYAVAIILIFGSVRVSSSDAVIPARAWRTFSAGWMAFYSVAFLTLLSAGRTATPSDQSELLRLRHESQRRP